MAVAMGCAKSNVTKLLKPGNHEIGSSFLVNLVNAVHRIAAERGEPVDWLTPAWIEYGGPKGAPLALKDAPASEMGAAEFREAVDRLALECLRRGYRKAGRALLDVIDVIDGIKEKDSI